jgi:adenylate kinase
MNQTANTLQGKLLFPFIAPPNGGKGTQTRILSQRYKLPTFDMGATFRAILKEGKDPALADELKSFMNQGKLVPIETVMKVFTRGFEELASQHPDAPGFILDGFPRNVDQADSLMVLCQRWGASIGKVIYLDVNMSVVERRATGRRFSADASRVYNIYEPQFMPKNKQLNPDGTVATDEKGREIWLDDVDNTPLTIRQDDEPETVQKRLVEYERETNPIIDKFRHIGLLADINGDQPPEKVTQDIEAAIQPILGLSPTA